MRCLFFLVLSVRNKNNSLFALNHFFLSPAGTKCGVQMPHDSHGLPYLTQILLLAWKIAHCAKHKGLRREMPVLPTTSVSGYLLQHLSSFCFSSYFFVAVEALSPPVQPHQQPLNPRDLNHQIGWPLLALCLFCSTQSTWQEVCYGGLVKTVSTGAKSSGAGLNGWAVRQPVLWWEAQTLCMLKWDGYWFPSTRRQKSVPCQQCAEDGLKVGGVQVCRNCENLSGDYELHLCFQVWHIF